MAGLQHTQTERFLSGAGGPFVVCTRSRAPLWAARDEADGGCEAGYRDGDFGQASGERARSLRGASCARARSKALIGGGRDGRPCRVRASVMKGGVSPSRLPPANVGSRSSPAVRGMSFKARRRSHRKRGHPDWPALLVKTHLFKRRGPGIRINQHQCWICNVLENRCEPHTFTEELVGPLEYLACLVVAVSCACSLKNRRQSDHCLAHSPTCSRQRCRKRHSTHKDLSEFQCGERGVGGRALHGAHSCFYPDGWEAVGNRLTCREVWWPGTNNTRIEPVGVAEPSNLVGFDRIIELIEPDRR